MTVDKESKDAREKERKRFFMPYFPLLLRLPSCQKASFDSIPSSDDVMMFVCAVFFSFNANT